jgi:ABC-2 type transport system permease protein
MVFPLHAAAVLRHWGKLPSGELPVWVYAGLPAGVMLGAVATWLPMKAGAKALRETEF